MCTGFEADKREFEDTTGNLKILEEDVFYQEYVKMSDIIILPFSYGPARRGCAPPSGTTGIRRR